MNRSVEPPSAKPVTPIRRGALILAAIAITGLFCECFLVAILSALGGLSLLLFSFLRKDTSRPLPPTNIPWPSVSIIIPVHNEERILRQTLLNLTNQIYPGPPLEIIAALNGCTDRSAEIVRAFPGIRMIESEKTGISFGRNLGARLAQGKVLVFVDADSSLPPDGIQRLVDPLRQSSRGVSVVRGRPDRGGPVVRIAFWIANWHTLRSRLSPPAGVTAVHREVFDAIGGFDETIPQGTVTDFIRRAMAAGAEYLVVEGIAATTSIRRFERTGIIRQMLEWRKNHLLLERGRKKELERRVYEIIR